MFILVETRATVVETFATQFAREGFALNGMQPEEFLQWLSDATKSEMSSVEGFLVGHTPDRPAIVRGLKARNARAVIGLSDIHSLDATLDLFSSGVDDLVRKPVHAREILARFHAIKRRSDASTGWVDIGALRVHFDGRDPEIDGVMLPLPRRERRILEFLAAHRGRRLTKAQIFQSIYGIFDDEVEESVIESHVSKLRKKLRLRVGYDVIDSKRYIGYCLTEQKAPTYSDNIRELVDEMPKVTRFETRPASAAIAALT